MSKTFDVEISVEGTICYEIEAEDIHEAKQKAKNQYFDENDAAVVLNYKMSLCKEKELPEVTECCPHCDKEITLLWDVQKDGYKAFCPKCGGVLMLCSMCLEDNTKCDWCDDSESCFRTRG